MEQLCQLYGGCPRKQENHEGAMQYCKEKFKGREQHIPKSPEKRVKQLTLDCGGKCMGGIRYSTQKDR